MNWIVSVKGKAESPSWEISVVHKDNEHGLMSYGWFDDQKILISHNGGPCHFPISKYVFTEQLKIADNVAKKLNNGESLD